MAESMTSMERVLCTLSGRQPDRVAYFLPVTMHGALEMGVPLGEYYSSARLVAEGQLRLRAKYRDDIVYPFFYGGIDLEAFGGEINFYDDGPPNSVGPLITDPAQLARLVPPVVSESLPLRRVLDAIEILARELAGEAPIAGVVMSPFSLPVMQLGFEEYIRLMFEQPEALGRLFAVNEAFCVSWANAQLGAGANMIGYFDPVSSPGLVPSETFHRFGQPLMRRCMAQFAGPAAALMASGRSAPILEDMVRASAAVVGVGLEEDLGEVKAAAAGRITIMGNLNGLQMRRWTTRDVEEQIRGVVDSAAAGGGYILSDAHGEIPIQVPEETLLAITAAVEEFGRL